MTTATNQTKQNFKAGLLMDCVLFPDDPPLEQILIVDDEEAVRELFVCCLESRYVCCEAESVADALEQLAHSEFELIITDLMMPDATGVDLLERVRELAPDTPVIMASGVSDPHHALEAVRRGAFDYLIKPCPLGELEITVERALEQRRLKLEARRYKLDLEKRNRQLAQGKAELELLQARLVQNEKMASLGQIAAGIAHEINNPLGFISGNLAVFRDYVTNLRELTDGAEYAAENSADGVESRADESDNLFENLRLLIDDCSEGAERISGIVRNLRTFSRLDEAEYSRTDVHEGIDSTVRLLSRYYSGGNLTLIRKYGELPLIDAFAGQLNQVWLNLLVNAAQAIGENYGTVTVETRVAAENIFIKISDDGAGIGGENLSRIFEPFYTTKPVGEGTGLGLSISFGIIARHGGTIEVESAPGKGTTFTIRLPVKNDLPTAEPSPTENLLIKTAE